MGNCMKTSKVVQSVSSVEVKEDKNKPTGSSAPGESKGQTTILSTNEQLVAQWIACLTSRKSVEDSKSLSTEDGFTMHFKHEDVQMPLGEFLNSIILFHDSFPDFKLEWKTITEISSGTVVVEHLQGQGTHTAAPYGFGPFPAIPATHKKITDAPCRCTATIRDGKLTKMVCDSQGKPSGPAHYYTEIGGVVFY